MYEKFQKRHSGLAGTVFVIVVLAMMAYLAIAALQGRHGLFSLIRAEAEEESLKVELNELEAARASIANKARRLSTETLDPDLLDEQSRRVLGVGRADEVIVR
jgi:cell division protein FtsB